MEKTLKNTHYWINEPHKYDIVFIFHEQTIYLTPEHTLPSFNVIKNIIPTDSDYYCFAESNTQRYLLLKGDGDRISNSLLKSIHLKTVWGAFPEYLQPICTLACHLHHWQMTHQYCGQCGQGLEDKQDERARVCRYCELIVYPRISPCIIVLIKRDREILLARSSRFLSNIYSVLAGFVEPGETIEAAVHREVYEEVGIKIKNLRYITSQPWPFPDSLMLGFEADYFSGDILVDGIEIEDAKWFDIDNLPELSSKMSIARQLIENHVNGRD